MTKPKALCLRQHEIQALVRDGRVLVIRPIKVLLIKPYPNAYLDAYNGGPDWWWWTEDNKLCNAHQTIRCPFGKPGDKRWIKESFATTKNLNHGWGTPIYKATFGAMLKPICEGFTPWQSSVRMKQCDSRLTTSTARTQAKPIQDFSSTDAKLANVPLSGYVEFLDGFLGRGTWESNPICWFAELHRSEF